MNRFGTPGYAASRADPNEGWGDALHEIVGKVRSGTPQCHVRYADGEFYSITGRVGLNADGQGFMPDTLGAELHDTLKRIADEKRPNVLVGGDWRRPLQTWDYLVNNGFHCSVPWCPVQLFVMGIESGLTMDLLVAVRDSPGKKYLVANDIVGQVAPALGATLVRVNLPAVKIRQLCDTNVVDPSGYGPNGAYADMPEVEKFFRTTLADGDIVIWCAGLGCKPSLYRMFAERPLTTHIDMGCFFDLAVGMVSRTWMTSPPDARQKCYLDKYVPWFIWSPEP